MNKTITVYFSESDERDYFLDEEYEKCYLELSLEIEKQGSKLYFTGGNDSYNSNGNFNNSWSFNNDNELVENGRLQSSVIFVKSNQLPFESDSGLKFVNESWVEDLCNDKFATYSMFKKVSPKTKQVENKKEWLDAIHASPGKMVVSKPVTDSAGNGVIIGLKQDVIDQVADVKFPAIVQRFINTSNGIPGLIDGIHDFRVLVLNGKIMYSYTRQPAKDGEYRANVALGGVMNIINNSEIPESALNLVKKVVKKIEEVGAVNYLIAIDMGFTMGGEPKLIELNSKPGFDVNSKHKLVEEFEVALAKVLINM